MKARLIWPVAVLVLAAGSGCVSMTGYDRAAYAEVRDLNLPRDVGVHKDPVLAGVLNVLPGIGNFYLAVHTEESAQWPIGVVNLVTWPVSILWGVPEAAIDAKRINKKQVIGYYLVDPRGRAALEQARAARSG